MAELFTNAVVAGAGYALVAVGFSFVYAVSRQFNFAHAGVYAWSAYLYYFATKRLGLTEWIGGAIAILGACLMGGLIEWWVYRPLRKRGGSHLALLVSSLGVLVALQNAICLVFGDSSKAVADPGIPQAVLLWPASVTPVRLAIVVASVFSIIAVHVIFQHTNLGAKARAVADDPLLAEIVGIDRNRIVLQVSIMGSGLAAIAAVLQAYDTSITPAMGFDVLLMAVVATIVGGVGSLRGLAVGCLLVGLVQCLGTWLLPSQWQDTLVFVVLILVLFLRPSGLFGKSI